MLRAVTRHVVFSKSWSIFTRMSFYAVAKGRASGIFMTWPDCEAQVKGFQGARYKKFNTIGLAQEFIAKEGGNKNNTDTKFNTSNNLKRSISASSSNLRNTSKPTQVKKRKSNYKNDTTEDSLDSDDSDGLSAILSKQLDDIEKRLKTFGKGVDKIITKGSKKAILIEPPQKEKLTTGENGFETDKEGFVHCYTDGACSSNGKNGARAGLGVYWGEGHSLNLSEPVTGRATNNCGEIQAATKAIKQAIQNGITKLAINTDSQFLINSVTKWMKGWKNKGWKLKSGEPVKNEIDFKDLDSVQNKIQIKWNYVEAHRGIHGNEMADQLAKAGASLYNN